MEKTVTMTREQLSRKCSEVISAFMESVDDPPNEGHMMLILTLVSFSGMVVAKVFEEEEHGNE